MSNEKHLGHRPYRVKGITDSVLRLGTQSSNTKESVDKREMRKIRKPILRISSDYKETFYHSAADAARAMGKRST